MNKINLAILWHMHQPPYLEPSSKQNLLPWAFLHGMKDYYDMGAIVAGHDRMRMNVNFTPSLLSQLKEYAAGTLADRTLQVMAKAPGDLTPAELEYLCRTCCGGTDLMAARFPAFVRIRSLYKAALAAGKDTPKLKPSEITDMTVLFLLSWCGPTLAAGKVASELERKASGYTPADRDAILNEARKLILETGGFFRKLSERGIVELSTTPATHPILPLLCSTAAAAEARPDVILPPSRFDSPDEARRQVEKGLAGFADFFGFKPTGMWPAEGSVSKQAVSVLARAGVRWIATDEEILRRSGRSRAGDNRRPWTWDGVSIFFRDHFLSDQIGFEYSRRPAAGAVDDFLAEMAARAASARSEDELVVVALDGENAWEYYPDGGYPFLDRLYGAVENSEFINPVTLGEYIERFGPGEPLENLASGSWIDGNFDTWIGDPVKNRAWDMLATARQATAAADMDDGARDLVNEHLLRAEASDWFWWFGKGHSSIHEKEFDFLFRRNLKAVYEDSGLRPPECLDRPVGQDEPGLPATVPTSFISPKITGRRDSYYKWVGAGSCAYSHGSIHRMQPVIGNVRFGFDRDFLYIAAFKFDGVEKFIPPGTSVRIVFLTGRSLTVSITRSESGNLSVTAADRDGNAVQMPEAKAAAVDVLEVALPLEALAGSGIRKPISISFFIEISSAAGGQERFPWDSSISFGWDPRNFEIQGWFV